MFTKNQLINLAKEFESYTNGTLVLQDTVFMKELCQQCSLPLSASTLNSIGMILRIEALKMIADGTFN